MPTLQVAPIYTDAWAKTAFEAQAVIANKPYWSQTVTLLGVTCSQYWVRFFYTEINLLRWVEDSSITTLTQEERLFCSMTDAQPWAYVVAANNEIKVATAINATTVITVYVPVPQWDNNFTMTRFSCQWCESGAILPTSSLKVDFCMLAPNLPGVGSVVLYTFTVTTPPPAYAEVSYTPATPYKLLEANSYSFRATFTSVGNPINVSQLWAKLFSIWRQRTA